MDEICPTACFVWFVRWEWFFLFLSDRKKEQESMTETVCGTTRLTCLLSGPLQKTFAGPDLEKEQVKLWLDFRNVILSFTFTLIPGGNKLETTTGTLSLKNWEAFVLADWPVSLIITASDPPWLAGAPVCHGKREGACLALAPRAPRFLRFWVQQFMWESFKLSHVPEINSPCNEFLTCNYTILWFLCSLGERHYLYK